MLKQVRLRRVIRVGLCFAGTVALICLFIRLFVPPSHHRIDLRKYQSNFAIMSPLIAPQVTDFEDFFILVIVSTSPDDKTKRRDAIRRTWGNCDKTHIKYKWKILFMMGKSSSSDVNEKIMAEHKQHGDLLIADYIDRYRNITTKLLVAFKWATQITCNYILKTDNDVYVDIPELIKWLLNRGDRNSLYGGVLYRGIVVRDRRHRHYVSKDELSLDYYPTFCKGSMYVLSASLLPKMLELSRLVTRIGPDDAYVGLLADQLGISPVGVEGFFQKSFLPYIFRFISKCELRDLLGIGDSLTPSQLDYIHEVKYASSATYYLCISVLEKFFLLLSFLVTLTCLLLLGCRRFPKRNSKIK